MALKQIRINEYTVNELRTKGETIGNPTDDTIIRYILGELEKLQEANKARVLENELLKKKLQDYTTTTTTIY